MNQVCTSLHHLCWNLYTFARARLFNYHRDLQSVHACTTWNFWFFVSPKGLGAKCTITWQEEGEGGEGGREEERKGKALGEGVGGGGAMFCLNWDSNIKFFIQSAVP